MTSAVQQDDPDSLEPGTPAGDLLAIARQRAAGWLTEAVRSAAERSGGMIEDGAGLQVAVDDAVRRMLVELADLLRTDVDAQRTTPLSLFRAAVAGPNRWLLDQGVRPPGGEASPVDRDLSERFPDDPFGLGPATWSDIHPDLHEPGITWGAWKAMTVLRRRQDEGRR